jgi:hypothetical protein
MDEIATSPLCNRLLEYMVEFTTTSSSTTSTTTVGCTADCNFDPAIHIYPILARMWQRGGFKVV